MTYVDVLGINIWQSLVLLPVTSLKEIYNFHPSSKIRTNYAGEVILLWVSWKNLSKKSGVLMPSAVPWAVSSDGSEQSLKNQDYSTLKNFSRMSTACLWILLRFYYFKIAIIAVIHLCNFSR